MTQTVSFTFDDDELASVVIQAIAKYLSQSKPDSVSLKSDLPETQEEWVTTQEMTHCLGVSVRTLTYYRDNGDLLMEGRHYRRATPAKQAPWIWNKALTLKAWEQA